jgi:hypothetical protein
MLPVMNRVVLDYALTLLLITVSLMQLLEQYYMDNCIHALLFKMILMKSCFIPLLQPSLPLIYVMM